MPYFIYTLYNEKADNYISASYVSTKENGLLCFYLLLQTNPNLCQQVDKHLWKVLHYKIAYESDDGIAKWCLTKGRHDHWRHPKH